MDNQTPLSAPADGTQSSPPDKLLGTDHWRSRRFALVVSSLFYAAVIVYVLALGRDSSAIHANALSMAFVALMSNVGAYIFGPIWEDLSMSKMGFVRQNAPFSRS